jgi:hypothetical protein
VTYVVRGFDWQARYQVVLRGELEDDTQVLSVDLLGTAGIFNPTARVFEEAEIFLIAENVEEETERPEEAGFLMLDEGPLASPWMAEEPPKPTSYTYRVPGRARLGGAGRTDVALVRSQRMPANRLYVMHADQFSLGLGTMKPLRKFISFQHKAREPGYALPPGGAQIFLGTRRTHLLQEGVLPRTDAGGEIRIDLGREESVLGLRRSIGLYPAMEGFREEGFEVLVRNLRDSEILVEVVEEAPLRLEWHVVRATERYQQVDQYLHFSPRIDPQSEKRIFYRLRLRRAGL